MAADTSQRVEAWFGKCAQKEGAEGIDDSGHASAMKVASVVAHVFCHGEAKGD